MNNNDVKDYFTANPQSMMEFLSNNGQCLYIPEYQRQFTWEDQKLEKLFDDSVHGFSKLIDQRDSVTFIGTVITILNTTLRTESPNLTSPPSLVMTIIDGQQRLTSLLMLTTVLHEKISVLFETYQNSLFRNSIETNEETALDEDTIKRNQLVDWLDEFGSEALGNLEKCFIEKQNWGQGDSQWYPRMARAYQDVWDKKNAKYLSPIAKHLFHYGIYSRKKSFEKPYNYLSIPDGERNADSEHFAKSLKKLQNLVDRIISKNDEEFPPDRECFNSTIIPEAILNNRPIPEGTQQIIMGEPNVANLTRLILFANFVLKRIGLTVVTAKTEDYAFDIFESLNTTGEPLTAYETFKPRVINKTTLKEYPTSSAKRWMDIIDNFFDNLEKNKKQDLTGRMLISFALGDTGTKLSSRISDQRTYLRLFDKIPDENKKHQLAFLKSLACTADFYKTVWTPDLKNFDTFADGFKEKEQAKLCIEVLRALQHYLTHGPLLRYYSAAFLADRDTTLTEKERVQTKQDFLDALKACTAFSILWRGSRKGTSGIDTEYRKLMSEPRFGLGPFARLSKSDGKDYPLPPIIDLKRVLCRALASATKGPKIANKQQWITAAGELAQYENNKTVTKFLLIAAMHDTITDPKHPGLLIKARPGTRPTLIWDTWKSESTSSIEHVAPQNENRHGDWASDRYDSLYESNSKDKIHRLGNLALLNIPDNARLSDRSWHDKRILYRALSAKTDDEIRNYREKASEIGISGDLIDEIHEKSNYTSTVESIACYDGEHWNEEIIEKRSTVLAGLIWDNLFPWLDPGDIDGDLSKAITATNNMDA